MKTLISVFSVCLATVLLLCGAASAQTSFDGRGTATYSGGSILPGYDNRTCTSSIGGAIRYNSSTACTEYCDGSSWTCPKLSDCSDDTTAACRLQATRSSGDSEFLAANIKSGENILGVTGSFTGLIWDRSYGVSVPNYSINYNCGILNNGDAYCIGEGSAGQLGNGAFSDSATLVPVSGGHKFIDLQVGTDFVCGLTGSGDVYCWGEGSNGELGNGSSADSASPVLVSGGHKFIQISSGPEHTCGVTDDAAIWCWGDRMYEKLGADVDCADSNVPVLVPGGHTYLTVEPTSYGTYAVRSDGDTYYWGWDVSCGPADPAPSQILFASSQQFHQIAASSWSGRNGCALDESNEAWCWGEGGSGQLGNGSMTDSPDTPVKVVGGHRFRDISTGVTGISAWAVCGVTIVGDAYCWGEGTFGQMGNGTTTSNNATPQLVSGGHKFTRIHTNRTNACAATEDGEVYCWGYTVGTTPVLFDPP